MTFLVDANVLSEATKPRPDQAVIAWLSENEAELAVNPIILGELQYGILLLPASKKRERLLKWFAAGVEHLPVLDVDAGTGSTWAQLLAELRRKGRAMPVKDSLLAATARIATLDAQGAWHDEWYTLSLLRGFDVYLFPGSDISVEEPPRPAARKSRQISALGTNDVRITAVTSSAPSPS